MRLRNVVGLIASALAALTAVVSAQRVADPNFDTTIARPAYASQGPRVLFDEAHHNIHTATGLYKPLADLLTADGYRVVPNTQKFTLQLLKGYEILVIANALGAAAVFPQEASNPSFTPEASDPAFTDEESDAVRDWVHGGGALLLIADHTPMGAANAGLAQRFGVEMSNAQTIDPANTTPERVIPRVSSSTPASAGWANTPLRTDETPRSVSARSSPSPGNRSRGRPGRSPLCNFPLRRAMSCEAPVRTRPRRAARKDSRCQRARAASSC